MCTRQGIVLTSTQLVHCYYSVSLYGVDVAYRNVCVFIFNHFYTLYALLILN